VESEVTTPTCSYVIVNANPRRIDFTIRDALTGLASIAITTAQNLVMPVPVPSFTAGTTATLTFSATKDDQSQPARIAVVLTDVDGNRSSCI
jgi:hypothetical protein